ncbi:MAG: phosphate ABC transporter substrate-binding protein [Leptospirales bacterium]|nr:phosphate ABC transporter substrate-binding protein [Leptospirales bacterium]
MIAQFKLSRTIAGYLALAAGLLFSACGNDPDLVISGSETMHPMTEQLVAAFRTAGSTDRIEMHFRGSNAGLRDLLSGKSDVAVSSRSLDDQERVELSKLGEFRAEVIAYDCLVLAVNTANPIKSLSLREASDIFSGRVRNWREIGGPDLPLQLVIRDENSGSTVYFREHVLRMADLGADVFAREGNRELDPSAQVVADNTQMAEFIEKNPGAVGYMGMASADLTFIRRVKPLDYALTPRERPVAPTIANVLNRTYRLSRPLFFVYLSKPNNTARDDQSEAAARLLTFITSAEGQRVVQRAGQLRALAAQLEVRGQSP